jgi:haloalkane dehalogenase
VILQVADRTWHAVGLDVGPRGHDNDRVAPLLGQTHRTITFDFVGWGHSTRPPAGYAYTVDSLHDDLDAVVAYFHLTEVIPVVHDASGWPGIDWALDHEPQVAALVLLNTVYHLINGTAPPYVIRALSSPDLRAPFLEALGTDDLMNRALFRAQVGEFFVNDEAKAALLPVLEASFPRAALIGLTENLLATVLARNANLARMQAFAKPVTVAFGAEDPFLNEAVAKGFAKAFPQAKLELVPSAGHYVQLDKPDAVVDAIRAAIGR